MCSFHVFWTAGHVIMEIVFSVVHWFPKWLNLNMNVKESETILRKPKHRLLRWSSSHTVGLCFLTFYMRSYRSCVSGLRLWESTAVWRKRQTCCCPLCQPCRRKLNIWSTTWAQRLASNWTCSRLWETPADSWKSLKVSAHFLCVSYPGTTLFYILMYS